MIRTDAFTTLTPADTPSLRQTRRVRRFFTLLAVLLIGLAMGGKGFAYVGMSPVFIGEVTLLLGLIVVGLEPRFLRIFESPVSMLITLFMVWGLIRTLPYFSTYRVTALRDAVVWIYAAWAMIVAGLLICYPSMLRRLLAGYRTYAVVFLVIMPAIFLLSKLGKPYLPRWPGTHVPIISLKGGDFMIQVSAITAFILAGLHQQRKAWVVLLIPVCLLLGGTTTRGGLVSFGGALLVTIALCPNNRTVWKVVAGSLILLTVFYAVDVKLPSTRGDREVSVRQLVDNATSLLGADDARNLESTKEWRLNWWADIWGYTFAGDYFWGGKGFGVNLATDDGYQVTQGELLRSPHNGHMTVLARSGVPGFMLWLGLQSVWIFLMFDRLFRARRVGRETWSSLFVFLIAAWTAMMLNTSFDVYIEGPVGGIWLWCVMGVGMAAAHLYMTQPEVLEDHAPGVLRRMD
ncbi:MAG: O-antigen ligase family protein [Planctomycetota bacterium]